MQNGYIFQTKMYFHKANKCKYLHVLSFFVVVANRDAWLKGPSRAAIWSMIACIYPCNWNNERWLLWAISHKFLIFLFNPGISCQCAGRSFGEETLRISFASPQTVIFSSFSHPLSVCLFELVFNSPQLSEVPRSSHDILMGTK